MNYTKQQRMEIAAAFRDAKVLIESGIQTYICCALQNVVANDGLLAKNVIRQRLGNDYHTLNSWLRDVAGVSWRLTEHSDRQMRLYRLRWLDALIKEFSE